MKPKRMEEAVILFLSDSRGVYIPQNFAESIHRELVHGVSAADWQVLEKGPEGPDYWEVWDSVLMNAKVRTEESGEYILWQDGDLFLLCLDRMTEEEKLNFGLEVEE